MRFPALMTPRLSETAAPRLNGLRLTIASKLREKRRITAGRAIPLVPSIRNSEVLNSPNPKPSIITSVCGRSLQAKSAASKIRGKPIGTLEEGDVDDVIEEIDIARKERLAVFNKLSESKGEWATRLPRALGGNDNSVDHFFTKFNFDTSTCLLKRRSNSSR